MQVQYAGGTIVSTTFVSDGTRVDIVTHVKDALVAAGWTLSVSGTNDFKLDSAIPTSGHQVRVRIYDPGTGNCARIRLSTVAETTISSDFYLLPTLNKTYRIIANRYQYFIMTAGTSSGREFVCGGLPYVRSFLTPTNVGWMHGFGAGDTDPGTIGGFRTSLFSSSGYQFSMYNGSSYTVNGAASPGSHRLSIMNGSTKWMDDTLHVLEPIIAWGLTSSNDTAKDVGQLWDAIVVQDSFIGDYTITFDGRTYLAITNGNTNGTLFVAVT